MSFDLAGPLPSGVAVLEASAGTGKTYTIAGLAARYVADGIPLEQLLVVSFTRAATGELRERVRERLSTLDRALAPDGEIEANDVVAQLLAAREDLDVVRGRIARALADFDAATIATIHQFCQAALQSIGYASPWARDCELAEEVDDHGRGGVADQ